MIVADSHSIKLEAKVYHIEGDLFLVPCLANYQINMFKPLSTPLGSEKIIDQVAKRKGWTENEDDLLLRIIKQRGAKDWATVAKELNCIIH